MLIIRLDNALDNYVLHDNGIIKYVINYLLLVSAYEMKATDFYILNNTIN